MIRDVLSSLPARRRAVILLRYGWGLEPTEICVLVSNLSARAYRKEITRGIEQVIERLRQVESGDWCRLARADHARLRRRHRKRGGPAPGAAAHRDTAGSAAIWSPACRAICTSFGGAIAWSIADRRRRRAAGSRSPSAVRTARPRARRRPGAADGGVDEAETLAVGRAAAREVPARRGRRARQARRARRGGQGSGRLPGSRRRGDGLRRGRRPPDDRSPRPAAAGRPPPDPRRRVGEPAADAPTLPPTPSGCTRLGRPGGDPPATGEDAGRGIGTERPDSSRRQRRRPRLRVRRPDSLAPTARRSSRSSACLPRPRRQRSGSSSPASARPPGGGSGSGGAPPGRRRHGVRPLAGRLAAAIADGPDCRWAPLGPRRLRTDPGRGDRPGSRGRLPRPMC